VQEPGLALGFLHMDHHYWFPNSPQVPQPGLPLGFLLSVLRNAFFWPGRAVPPRRCRAVPPAWGRFPRALAQTVPPAAGPKFPAKCCKKMPWRSQVHCRVQEITVPQSSPQNVTQKCLGSLKSVSEFRKVRFPQPLDPSSPQIITKNALAISSQFQSSRK